MSLDRFSLDGKVVLVTGASSGIGYQVAQGLAAAGAAVVAGARRIDRLESLVQQTTSTGHHAIAIRLDVTDRDSVRAAFDEAEKAYGVVDVVINNAGVSDPKSFLKVAEDKLDFVMQTNFKGVWHIAQEAAQRMVEHNKGGSIINIASILGLGVQPNLSSYCASKGAVVQLTRSMALDLGKQGIRVNAIAPGYFETEITGEYLNSELGRAFLARTPARRAGRIDDLIGPIIMLASDAGAFVNGVILPVDGAHSAALIS